MLSTSQKIVVLLMSVATIGTVVNWILKLHDQGVAFSVHHMELRIEQLQDECNRKLSAQKEDLQQAWKKKLKEIENSDQTLDGKAIEDADADITDVKTLQERNKQLTREKESLHQQLDSLKQQHSRFQAQIEGIQKIVREEDASKKEVDRVPS